MIIIILDLFNWMVDGVSRFVFRARDKKGDVVEHIMTLSQGHMVCIIINNIIYFI